jgi:hexosaminidase
VIHRLIAAGVVVASTLGAFPAIAQTSSSAFNNTLMPQPSHLTVNAGSLPITPQFTAAADKFHDARLDAAIGRMLVQLMAQTGVQMATTPASSAATLSITVDGPGQTIQGPART